MDGKTKDQKTKLTELFRSAKKAMKIDIKKYKTNIYKNSILQTGGLKKGEKRLNHPKKWIHKLYNKEGTEIKNRKDLIEAATKFYRELYTSERDMNEVESNQQTYRNNEKIPKILTDEVLKAIKSLQSDKSPGKDGVREYTGIFK